MPETKTLSDIPSKPSFDVLSISTNASSRGIRALSCASGNDIISRIAYLMSEMVLVHPLKSSSYLGQCTEQFAKEGKRNCSQQICHVQTLDTTIGCGNALMGMLSQGVSVSVLCSSPSIREMIPRLYLLASSSWREKLRNLNSSCVLHVSSFGYHDLILKSDYTDILHASETGIVQIHSYNVQECHDMALISHLAASRVHLPFLHFFDGTRTGNEISKVDQMPFDKLVKLKMLYSENDKNSTVADSFPTPILPKKKIPDFIDDIMQKMSRYLKRRYSLFKYVGSGSAENIIVSLCSQNETTALSDVIMQEGRNFGLVVIRLLRPWSTKHFLQALPPSAKRCIVVASASSSVRGKLLAEVSTSILKKHQSCQVLTAQFQNTKSFGFTKNAVLSLLNQLNEACDPTNIVIDCSELKENIASPVKSINDSRKVLVWDCISDGEAIVNAGIDAITLLGDYSPFFVHGVQFTDCYQPGNGTAISYLHFNETLFPPPSIEMKANCVFCNNVAVLNQFNVAGELNKGGILVLNCSAKTDDLEELVPTALKRILARQGIKLYTIDTAALLEQFEMEEKCLQLFLQIAIFYFSGLWKSIEEVSNFLKDLNHETILDQYNLTEDVFFTVVDDILKAPELIEIPEPWKDAQDFEEVVVTKDEDLNQEKKEEEKGEEKGEEAEEVKLVPIDPIELPLVLTPSLISYSKKDEIKKYSVDGWHKAAWSTMFPDIYDSQTTQKPFEHEETFICKVLLNKRLTPDSYSRNIFHIEFSTAESGLKYGIGDALGVFPHNLPEEVSDFLNYYGIDPMVTVSINIGGRSEIRTVEQVFTQVLDLFGRPGRRFYESLSKFAQDPKEKGKLEWLGSADGGPAFKKRVDDTITYAELLREFSSCKLTVADIMDIIPPIKPRHYSIASAQSMHPNSVHLLVVVVEWKQPSNGKQRFGLCSKYLADLKIGDAVTVDVKPSMMKLPEDPAAPIIMSGLGTGMAPFRAFIEERAVQYKKGIKVGPMSLYMGSRSQWKEYLYGEELEAYHQSGLLTELRCAFSRDQEHKIYIQHLMNEDSDLITEYLHKKEGTFYLCGPTWPVADVEAAIHKALMNCANMESAEAKKYIRAIKEDERYVLEVY